VSGANQYSVRPSALVSTVTPPIFAVFNVIAVTVGDLSALATAMASRTKASTETPPTAAMTIGAAACIRCSIRAVGLPGSLACGDPSHGQRHEGGNLDQAGGEPWDRADLLESVYDRHQQ